MSGVNRNVQADIIEKGLTGQAAMDAMSPDAIRNEKGTYQEDVPEGTSHKPGK